MNILGMHFDRIDMLTFFVIYVLINLERVERQVTAIRQTVVPPKPPKVPSPAWLAFKAKLHRVGEFVGGAFGLLMVGSLVYHYIAEWFL